MDRRSFIKGLIALASAPAIGKYVNVFKTEGARKGIENVASQGVDFFNSVIKKVMDEGTLLKEEDRISTFKHPDRPDITVDVNQTDGTSSVYFNTDEGGKAMGEIQKTADETTKGRTVEELFEQEEVYGPMGREPQEGITGGITNLEEFLKRKKGFAAGGRVGMVRGGIPKGLQAAMQALRKKFGDDIIKTVEDTPESFDNYEISPYFNIDRPEKAIARDKFKNFGKEGKFAEDGTIDYDYYAQILNDSENTFVTGDETIEELEFMLKEHSAEMEYLYNQYKTGKLDPVAGEKTEGRKRFLQNKLDEAEASGDNRLITRDEMDELESFDLSVDDIKQGFVPEKIDISQGMIDLDELNFTKNAEAARIKMKYPGISDDLIKKILIDDDRLIKLILTDKNPQRIAEVKQTIREALEMQKKGIGPDEIIQMFKEINRTKQADGGIIGLTAMKIPDNSKSGVESLFKRR